VESRGDSFLLRCTDSDAALRALLSRYAEAKDIEVTGGSLEEAFIELTGAGADTGAGAGVDAAAEPFRPASTAGPL